MEYIFEQIETKIIDSCDVLVAGGGVAGIAAALSAARTGARVLLLEQQYILGGLATAGLVTFYLPLCDGMGHQVSFGISEELLRLSIRYGHEASYPDAWLENGTAEERQKQRFQVQYNPHLFAIAAEQLLRKEGVTILYGASVCAVHKTGRKIDAVIFESKSGRGAIKVKSVVDATGDGDVCSLSGAQCALFQQKNVLAGWYYSIDGKDYALRMLGAADVPEEERDENSPKPLTERRFKGLDCTERSEMVQLSHDFLLKDVFEHRKSCPAYTPVTIPSIPQLRMTRRICGIHTLSHQLGQTFTDSIGMIGNWKKRGPVYQIPFRALYGADIANLITAGRCISVTDTMWDITRVIPVCAVTGEAAGTAAALTDDFSKLDVAVLQKELRKNHVVLQQEQL